MERECFTRENPKIAAEQEIEGSKLARRFVSILLMSGFLYG
jgi:hypothetical protein